MDFSAQIRVGTVQLGLPQVVFLKVLVHFANVFFCKRYNQLYTHTVILKYFNIKEYAHSNFAFQSF